jgi:hypothetical protein
MAMKHATVELSKTELEILINCLHTKVGDMLTEKYPGDMIGPCRDLFLALEMASYELDDGLDEDDEFPVNLTMTPNLIAALDAQQLAELPEELKAAEVDAQLQAEDYSNFITVTKGQLWFAVMFWWNIKEDFLAPGDGFWEPWTTGMGRYSTQAEAISAAQAWASAEGVRYVAPTKLE